MPTALSWCKSQRGDPLPILKNYLFRPKNKERTRFVCITPGCNATIHVEKRGNRFYATETPKHLNKHHNHKKVIAEKYYIDDLKNEGKKDNNR